MKKIHISFLHNLGHVEFKTFYTSLLRLMQKQEFADPALKELHERLKSRENDVKSLRHKVVKSDQTPVIDKLSRLRTDYLISLRLEVKAKKLSYIPEMRKAAERLHTWLKRYKKEPYIQSVITQDTVVDSILGCIRENESLRADIALLNLNGLIDAIDKTTQQIDLNIKYREQDKLSKNKPGRHIRDAAYDEVKTLANYLEYKLSLIHDKVEESEHYILLLEIDMRLKDIRKNFRIRTAKDKTRRTKKATAKQLAIEKQTEMNQPEAVNQSSQQKSTLTELTEIVNHPSMKNSLTDKPLKTLPKTITKQKKGISKPMMKRRKIKKLLV